MRGKPSGKNDCVFVRIEDFLNNGYSPKMILKVNRRWLESIGFKAISEAQPIEIEEVENPEAKNNKIEFEVR